MTNQEKPIHVEVSRVEIPPVTEDGGITYEKPKLYVGKMTFAYSVGFTPVDFNQNPEKLISIFIGHLPANNNRNIESILDMEAGE